MNMQMDYEQTLKDANVIKGQCDELNNELLNVYKSVESLHDSWYGVRYNELVDSFNNVAPSLNGALESLFTSNNNLRIAATNYWNVDRGTSARAEQAEYKNMPSLNKPSDVGMKFMEAGVSQVRNSIKSNFSKSKELLNSMGGIINRLNWSGQAKDSYVSNFQSASNKINQAFDDLSSSFDNLMNQAIDDMNQTENASTVR